MKRFFKTVGAFARRFPAIAAFSFVGIWIAHQITYAPKWYYGDSDRILMTMMAMFMAFAAAAVAQITLERLKTPRWPQFVAAGASLVLFTGLTFLFRWIGDADRADFLFRYLLSLGAMLALFAFALAKPEDEERNLPILVGSAILGVAVAIAAWGPLALVFLALDKLFGVSIEKIYEFLFFVSILSLAPAAFVLFATRDTVKVGEKSLRIVMDYILGPLALVNLAILVAYLAKSLTGQSLPKGEITLLVSSASSVWILFCMVFSYSGTGFSMFFRQKVGYAIIPLLILQSVAISMRINQYGLTPMRYLVCALTLFFAVAAFLSVFRRGRLVRWLYVVFAAFALFAAFSPLNAFDASIMAQKARVRRIFRKAGVAFDESFFADRLKVAEISKFQKSDQVRLQNTISFVQKFHKSCGLYVASCDRDFRPYEPKASPQRYYADHWWLPNGRRFSLDVSRFCKMYPAEIEWHSGVENGATKEEKMALAERNPSIEIVVHGLEDSTVRVPVSVFNTLIMERNIQDERSLLDIGNGRSILLLQTSHARYYRLDENAPISAENVIPAEIRATCLFFEGKRD